jgi:hypothetical protein
LGKKEQQQQQQQQQQQNLIMKSNRLVRLSPFIAKNKRQPTFAAVDVAL